MEDDLILLENGRQIQFILFSNRRWPHIFLQFEDNLIVGEIKNTSIILYTDDTIIFVNGR